MQTEVKSDNCCRRIHKSKKKYFNSMFNHFSYLIGLLFVLQFVDAQNEWISINTPSNNAILGIGYLNGNLFASTTQGIWKTTNSGSNWILSNYGLSINQTFLTYIYDSKSNLYVGDLLHKSSNFGDEWTTVKHFSSFAEYVSILNDTLYGRVNDSIIMSTDYGITWKKISSGKYYLTTVNSNLIFSQAHDEKIFISTDIGKSWELSFPPYSEGDPFLLNRLSGNTKGVYYDVKGRIYIALRKGNGADEGRLFRSIDNGKTWVNLSVTFKVKALFGDDYGNIYIVADRIYKSSNAGQSWEDISIGLPNTSVTAFNIISNTIYVGLSGPYLYKKQIITENRPNGIYPIKQILYQNYPNPFNPRTTIRFTIPEESRVRITLYNILGQSIAEVLNEVKNSGTFDIPLVASFLSAGLYYCKMETIPVNSKNRVYAETIKINLIK